MPPKAYAIQASLRTVFHKILAADADDESCTCLQQQPW